MARRFIFSLTMVFLLVEFFDELHYGVQSAALPALRTDLALDYAQVGILLGFPKIVGILLEPLVLLAGDSKHRKALVIGGGWVILASLLLTAASLNFWMVLAALLIAYPASGAFVSLSQATLMDLNSGREAQMMARWTVSGSLANLAGPLIASAVFALGGSWRWLYAGVALFLLPLLLTSGRQRFPAHVPAEGDEAAPGIKLMLSNLRAGLSNRDLLRWSILLELADLLLDVFAGFAVLYYTDVMGLSEAQTGLLLAVLMGASLVADLLLIPALERFNGLKMVRYSALAALALFPAWLLAPWLWLKVVLMVALRFSTIGWYQVLMGEAYASAPGRSGTVTAINSSLGFIAGGLTWIVGWLAERAGLPMAMTLLLLAPLSLLLFARPRNTL